VSWIVQLVPFQISATVDCVPAITKYPTAVHAALEAHDTPYRRVRGAPDALGVLWIVQLLPLNRSASVTVLPVLSV
jgi:hypothetical protein